jgi:YidC/Oxa1 family membrane protein insertase
LDITPVTEQLGFLKALGLDYGWGPTALIQTILEHVYIYTGAPWWAAIGITAVAIRAVLFKLYVDASDTSARMQTLAPHVKDITDKIAAARISRNTQEMLAASQEMRAANKAAGIQQWKAFLPMLTFPLGFGTFRLMRGMADLPVPGLDQGGLLWIKDLTVPDPLYVLPVFTAAAFYYTFKVFSFSPCTEFAN